MKKKILITIADGFHYRYLVDTDIVNKLSLSYQLTIISIPALVADLINYRSENGLQYEILGFSVKPGKFKYLFQNIYKKIVVGSSSKLTETLNIKNENSKASNPIFELVLKLAKNNPSVFNILLRSFKSSFSEKNLEKLFKGSNFDLVITSTPGQKEFDLPFLYYAKKLGIKSISPVYSWDNLTAKGPFYFNPDFLLVWNNIMRQEGIYYHGYNEKNIFACGVPVFDQYPSILNEGDQKDSFKSSLGLSKEYPLVTLTTIPQVYYGSSHLTIAAELLKERGKKIPYFSLLLRPHPMDETNYSSLASNPDFLIDEYGSKPDKSLKNWKPAKDNVLHLGRTMKYSDVVLNIASTITIDAACFDTPVINICFDLKQSPDDYAGNISRYYKYTHYKHIVEEEACFMSESMSELIEHIGIYLKDSKVHSKERKNLVEKQAMAFDGLASVRIVDKISEIMNEKP